MGVWKAREQPRQEATAIRIARGSPLHEFDQAGHEDMMPQVAVSGGGAPPWSELAGDV